MLWIANENEQTLTGTSSMEMDLRQALAAFRLNFQAGPMQALVSAGADVHQLVWEAIHESPDDRALWVLWQAKVDFNIRLGTSGMPPLALAVAKGNIKMVDNLIYYKANIKGTDAAGLTALHHAVLTGNKDMVYFLLKNDADVTAKTTQGLLAEDLARTYNHTDIETKLHRRMQGLRGLAFAMATQDRLGKHSAALNLNKEVMQIIHGDHWDHMTEWKNDQALFSMLNAWE